MRDSVGIPEVSWHDLRHTYTTWGRKAGLNAEAMRDLPGHESVKTTLDIYSPANDQGAAAMAIEDYALGGNLLPLSVTPLAGDQELTHGKQWWARGDSNSGPPACEARASAILKVSQDVRFRHCPLLFSRFLG